MSMSRPMIPEARHVLVSCDYCGTDQDINDGQHLFRVNGRRACEACMDAFEAAERDEDERRAGWTSDDLRAGDPSRA